MELSKLSEFLASLGEPPFRFRQIQKNYFSGHYANFSDMTDLPLGLRQLLKEKFSLYSVKLENLLKDNFTQKALLSLADGLKIETVLMDYDNWLTACVSSQIGCPLGCKFCATGKMGFIRNLTPQEIVDQILFWKHYLSPLSKGEAPAYAGERDLAVRRVVFMGMGEPFLNWDNLISALSLIKNDLNLGSRKISISTAGIIDGINKFAELNSEINLAVSLHSADQKIRESIMPVARQYPLADLKKSLDRYVTKTHRQVFFEYALIKDTNDTPRQLKLLIDFIKSNKLFFLNIIPLNPIKGGLTPSPQPSVNNFIFGLKKADVEFSIRHSLGQSINSACGQLIVD